jgi:hypothetical protein
VLTLDFQLQIPHRLLLAHRSLLCSPPFYAHVRKLHFIGGYCRYKKIMQVRRRGATGTRARAGDAGSSLAFDEGHDENRSNKGKGQQHHGVARAGVVLVTALVCLVVTSGRHLDLPPPRPASIPLNEFSEVHHLRTLHPLLSLHLPLTSPYVAGKVAVTPSDDLWLWGSNSGERGERASHT